MPDSIRIERRIVKNWVMCGLVAILFMPCWVLGAFERLPVPADAAGRAGSGLSVGAVTAQWLNPAATCCSSVEAGWSLPFGLAEYRTRHLGLGTRLGKYSAGLAFANSGDEAYLEQTLRACANRDISSGIRVGGAVSWHRLEVASLDNGNALSLDLGANAELRPDLSAAAAWKNVTRARLTGYDDRLPESLSAGLVFRPEQRVSLLADLIQDSGHAIEGRLGVEARVTKFLILRTGALFDPLQQAFGFTICQRMLRVSYALQWHSLLGATHFAGLEFRLK